MFYSYKECSAAMFFQRFPITHVLRTQEAPCVLSPWVFIQAMWCSKMFWNLSIINFIIRRRWNIYKEIIWRFRYSLVVKRWQCRSVKVVKRWFQHWFDSWLHWLQIFLASLWQPIILACVSLQRKSFTDTFWWPQFSIWWLKKILVTSWRLPKKVNFVPWLSLLLCNRRVRP